MLSWEGRNPGDEGQDEKREVAAALIIQNGYVGFYFMPVYADSSLAAFFKPELLTLLKGKSCFHIKTLDVKLEKAVERALKKEYALYKERGWI